MFVAVCGRCLSGRIEHYINYVEVSLVQTRDLSCADKLILYHLYSSLYQ